MHPVFTSPATVPALSMLAVLTVISVGNAAVAVIAPEAAPDIGVQATDIGIYTAVLYGCAMLSGTLTGVGINRFGAVRVSQFTALCGGVGIATIAFASPWTALLSAVLLGTAYGTFNPASAHLLADITQPRWRPLVFSIKQLGVPLGGMLAGIVVPWLLLRHGWQAAVLFLAVAGVVIAVALQPLRMKLDYAAEPRGGRQLAILRPILAVLRSPVLRRLACAGFAYAGCQLSVGAFFVVYLVDVLKFTLIDAGLVFATLQAGGVAGRVFWGLLAERLVSTAVLLAGLGVLSAVCLASLVWVAHWQLVPLLLLGFVLGASSFGWVGIYLSEIASRAAPGQVGDATGGAQFVHFGGASLVPMTFGAVVGWSGSFNVAFAVLMVLTFSPMLYFLVPLRAAR